MTDISGRTRLSVSYIALVLVILFGAITFTAQAIDNSSYLAAIDHPAQLTRDGLRSDALAGQEIKKEDRLETGTKGRANIALGSDMQIYLASNSGILVRQLHSSSGDDGGLKGILTVEKGMVRVSSRVNSRPLHLRIEQETLKADIKKPASFMVNHNAGTDIICLFTGEINVKANNDSRVLKTPNTCFLYNGATGASSVRNIENKQIQAVIALTRVSSPTRQPLFASRTVKPETRVVTTTQVTPTQIAAAENTTKVLPPSAATNAPAAVAASAPETAAVTQTAAAANPTAANNPPATTTKPTTTHAGGVDTEAGAGLLNMMRRPAPGQELSNDDATPKQTVVATSRHQETLSTTQPTPTSKTTATAPVTSSKPPVVTANEATASPSQPAATRSRPTISAAPKQPAAAITATNTSKPTRAKPQRRQASKRYPTPSGKLEQWTINLAAYSQPTNATALIVKLRKLGYKPIMRKITTRNKSSLYRLSISGLKSRIAAEAEARKVLAETSISNYWLENIYLSR
jgi:cell division septation protein DedD